MRYLKNKFYFNETSALLLMVIVNIDFNRIQALFQSFTNKKCSPNNLGNICRH